MARLTNFLILLVIIYVAGYVAFRQAGQEVWQKDQQTYVMFPCGALGQALYPC